MMQSWAGEGGGEGAAVSDVCRGVCHGGSVRYCFLSLCVHASIWLWGEGAYSSDPSHRGHLIPSLLLWLMEHMSEPPLVSAVTRAAAQSCIPLVTITQTF